MVGLLLLICDPYDQKWGVCGQSWPVHMTAFLKAMFCGMPHPYHATLLIKSRCRWRFCLYLFQLGRNLATNVPIFRVYIKKLINVSLKCWNTINYYWEYFYQMPTLYKRPVLKVARLSPQKKKSILVLPPILQPKHLNNFKIHILCLVCM